MKRYRLSYKNKVISPAELLKLADICYTPWKELREKVTRKWEVEELPKLNKKIDQHNKDVEAKKSVYSFNTYLPIPESEKQKIVEKERKFFIGTQSGVYDFQSEFTVSTTTSTNDGRVVETNTTPDFLNDIKWDKVADVTFKVTAENGTSIKKIDIEISTNPMLDNELSVIIAGDDDDWVRSTKTSLDEKIRDLKDVNLITHYRLVSAIIASSLLSYLVFALFYKFNINDILWGTLRLDSDYFAKLVAVIIFISFISKTYPFLLKVFPSIIITNNYNPFANIPFKILTVLLTAAVGNAFYDGLGVLLK